MALGLLIKTSQDSDITVMTRLYTENNPAAAVL